MDINNIDYRKESIDQLAHFAAGLAPLIIFVLLGMNVYLAAVIIMAFAVGREIKQRLDRKDVWYGCSWGCRLDLLFWLLGVVAGIIIYYLAII